MLAKPALDTTHESIPTMRSVDSDLLVRSCSPCLWEPRDYKDSAHNRMVVEVLSYTSLCRHAIDGEGEM